MGRSGFVLVVLGAAFRFVGYGRWALLLIIMGGILAIVDLAPKKASDHPPAI